LQEVLGRANHLLSSDMTWITQKIMCSTAGGSVFTVVRPEVI
jgi:hypothetical protein